MTAGRAEELVVLVGTEGAALSLPALLVAAPKLGPVAAASAARSVIDATGSVMVSMPGKLA